MVEWCFSVSSLLFYNYFLQSLAIISAPINILANTSYWPYISQGPIHFSLLMASYYLQIFGNCAVMRTKSSWLCFTILEHGQLKNVKRLPTSASLLSHSSSSVVEVFETRRKFLGASISEKNDKADNVGDTETHSQRL